MNTDNSDNEGNKKKKSIPKKKVRSPKHKSPPVAPPVPAPAAVVPQIRPPPAFNLNNFLSSANLPAGSAAAGSPARVNNLSAFGLSASPTSASFNNKDSKLRGVVIESPNGAYLIFRAQPNDERNGSLGEKYLFDAMRQKEANWTENINMNKSCLQWYDDNTAIVNNRGYNIRLFVIHLGAPEIPEHDKVINLAEYVCHQINTAQGNSTITRVDHENFYWVPRGECCWYDVLGWDQALRKLLRKTGPPTPGYFEKNMELIRSYFHEGTLPQQLATFLYAPANELHISLRKAVDENSDDEAASSIQQDDKGEQTDEEEYTGGDSVLNGGDDGNDKAQSDEEKDDNESGDMVEN
jgi:hypothetical protein